MFSAGQGEGKECCHIVHCMEYASPVDTTDEETYDEYEDEDSHG